MMMLIPTSFIYLKARLRTLISGIRSMQAQNPVRIMPIQRRARTALSAESSGNEADSLVNGLVRRESAANREYRRTRLSASLGLSSIGAALILTLWSGLSRFLADAAFGFPNEADESQRRFA